MISIMSWHYELHCDSCNFVALSTTPEACDIADEHELSEVDHWVQMVQIEEK